jgi:glucosyl-3-phosphoglycerate synthase
LGKTIFKNLLLPVVPGVETPAALGLAKAIGGQVNLVALLSVPEDEPISAVASTASEFRTETLKKYRKSLRRPQLTMRVAHAIVEELRAYTSENPHDLLILEWPAHFEALQSHLNHLLECPNCNIAIVRGPWPEKINRILLPMRGGPHAEMVLRLGRHLPHEELYAVNFSSSRSPDEVEAPFRGLFRILPNLTDVKYRRYVSSDPLEGILTEAKHADLVVMGVSARPAEAQGYISTIPEEVLKRSSCPVVVVKAQDDPAKDWLESEGKLIGTQAISLLVDRWFAENTFRAKEFDDLEALVEIKKRQGMTVSLALPALNEEETVGNVILMVKKALMEDVPLVDEMVLIDSNSTDQTREIATDLGLPVYIHQELLPQYGERRGKGEALWKSLLVTHGDILVWIDTDITNIHPRFVYGVIGPMLVNPNIQFVKGFYRRPLKVGDKIQAGGGGRVTELTARPLLNLFYPELSGVIQPLSGEYGGRRQALERLHFFSGYGVEIGLLIECFEKLGISAIAQVDLLKRIHRNQSLEALSKMSFVVLQAFIRKLEGRMKVQMLEDVNRTMKLVRYKRGDYFLDVEDVAEYERPPMIEIPEYRSSHL